jgi:two-component system, chemotaxis family, protein-glutamate methylesterase/glutaminase
VINEFADLRVLIVDDDPVYRRIVTLALQRLGVSNSQVAADLSIARSKLQREAFDVVTIDVVLSGESGLDLLPWVHQHYKKIATILLTSGSKAQANKAVDALLLGASALILKPIGADASRQLDAALSNVLASVAREKKSTSSGGAALCAQPAVVASDRLRPQPRELVALGASTGGPPVLLELLNALPKDYATPMLIVQHMPALHMPHFADLLRHRAKRQVIIPADGEAVRPDRIYVAPGGLHMVLRRSAQGLTLTHSNGPEEHNCKPAVNPLFRSVAAVCGHLATAVVLSGMGEDGATGAAEMRAAGAPILVQDRKSSVVWGMPGAVVARGAADIVASAAELARWVVSLDSSYRRMERKAL